MPINIRDSVPLSIPHNFCFKRSKVVPKSFIIDYLLFIHAVRCPKMNTLSVFIYSSRRASVGGMRLMLRAGI